MKNLNGSLVAILGICALWMGFTSTVDGVVQHGGALAIWQDKTPYQTTCAKKPNKTHYTTRQTKNGTSFSSRTKRGNTTITQMRTAKGKTKTTISTRTGNSTYIRQY